MTPREKTGQLRIVGGQWRGRRFSFPATEGLRPTGDRVRETLFNWLQGVVHGARCADLFAGSGVLGLEALSRGADHCDFVDTSAAALRSIEAHLAALRAGDRARCHRQSAESFLQQALEPYDIVFVDPPFGGRLVEPCCKLLAARGLLAAEARVYIETGLDDPPPAVPGAWTLHRDKRAGGVAYRLFVVGPG
jgi:16S rRNA (guanine966-N2)-methyltransferase